MIIPLVWCCWSLATIAESMRDGAISARIHGDMVVGALFSVHDPPRDGQGALVCGSIREVYGIQRVEAAIITMDKINRDPTILPGVTLGLEVRDSCWSAPVALQQSIELIRDAITPAQTQSQHPDNIANCPMNLSQTEKPKKRAPLIGVVGPGSSSVTLQVQNLLQLFSIPQIGYSSTSRDLNDITRYSSFLRVVPSDYYQAQLLVDLVKYFNWTYVSIVHTDENYGQSGIHAFREIAGKSGVCVAREDAALSTANNDTFDRVITNLNQDQVANVVVCFCEGMTMKGLLAASKRLNLTGRFLFIGSDGWADRDEVVQGLEEEAKGSLSIRIRSPYMSEFDDHYFNLNPFNNDRNPWFREFWEDKFNCVLPETLADKDYLSSRLKTMQLPSTKRNCTGNETLTDKYKQDPKMSFVMKSFWVLAYGLHSMLQEICGHNYTGVCDGMRPFNGTLFRKHLLNVNFNFGQEEVEFDRSGDPPGRYEILNFQRLSNGTYEYIQIGDWNNGVLSPLAHPQSRGAELVKSVCSKPCASGYYRNLKTGGQEKACCWACVKCENNAYTHENQSKCIACSIGEWPNENKTGCSVIPMEYMAWGDAEAVVAMTFSAVGLLATFATCRIFIRHNDTPVVKASTRELSYLILAGMTLAHIAIFPILAKPSRTSCAMARLMPGISFAMMYASLFTKTNRIARILAGSKKRFPTRKPLFMSGTAQVVITCILILIEAGVATVMLYLEPSTPRQQFPSHNRVILTCATSPLAVLSPLAFDGILLGLCTLYAVKTRNVPENFNEAKFIGFAMYTTCVIWVAFVPIYFGSESKVITMCMCVTLSASVTLIFLFLPKIYIIVLRPERNNRSLFTTSKSIRCHIGARVAAAIAEPPSKQTIYRLSNIGQSESIAYRNVSRRTASVQTGSELLNGIIQMQESPCQMTKPKNQLTKSTTPVEPHNSRSIKLLRISKSSENVSDACRQPACNRVRGQCRSQEINTHLGVYLDGSKLQLPEWAELDVRNLVDDLRKCSMLPVTNLKVMDAIETTENKERHNSISSWTSTSTVHGNYFESTLSNGVVTKIKDDTAARIREESDHLAENDDSVIKITITLGDDLTDGHVDIDQAG